MPRSVGGGVPGWLELPTSAGTDHDPRPRQPSRTPPSPVSNACAIRRAHPLRREATTGPSRCCVPGTDGKTTSTRRAGRTTTSSGATRPRRWPKPTLTRAGRLAGHPLPRSRGVSSSASGSNQSSLRSSIGKNKPTVPVGKGLDSRAGGSCRHWSTRRCTRGRARADQTRPGTAPESWRGPDTGGGIPGLPVAGGCLSPIGDCSHARAGCVRATDRAWSRRRYPPPMGAVRGTRGSATRRAAPPPPPAHSGRWCRLPPPGRVAPRRRCRSR